MSHCQYGVNVLLKLDETRPKIEGNILLPVVRVLLGFARRDKHLPGVPSQCRHLRGIMPTMSIRIFHINPSRRLRHTFSVRVYVFVPHILFGERRIPVAERFPSYTGARYMLSCNRFARIIYCDPECLS